MSATHESSAGDMALSELLAEMQAQRLAPLWQVYDRIVLREPQGVERSHHWRWSALDDLIAQAMTAVTGELADHRVLLLQHPDLGGRIATTPNLLAGIQCVTPGESTVPHRHTASAVRFVIESEGAQTFVDGKGCTMHPGDVVITPNWTWHSHANPTQSRAVWVDMLDVPLMGLLGATFGARGGTQCYPQTQATLPDCAFGRGGLVPVTPNAATPYSPRTHWRREDVLEVLEHAPARRDGSRLLRYTNPVSGGAVMETLDVYALALRRSQETAPFRTSATALCLVAAGEGETRVGGLKHRWRKHDLFTLPQWTSYTHRAVDGDAQLLMVTDRELYRRLGLLREECVGD